jgi:hypothetical protein
MKNRKKNHHNNNKTARTSEQTDAHIPVGRDAPQTVVVACC